MLDQKSFGQKLRNHRKNLSFTQEEAAERIGVSPQAISKWEAGECLPDCFNLKIIADVYHISLDVLLETESVGDLAAVSDKITQLGSEFIWSKEDTSHPYTHKELGDELWEMWKSLFFLESGNKKEQEECKQRGNTRISGNYGLKLWDDAGVACIIKSSFIKDLKVPAPQTYEVLSVLASADGQTLIRALSSQAPVAKEVLLETTGIAPERLNELLLLLLESNVIEFTANKQISDIPGYRLSGRCGIVAHMLLAAGYILEQKYCTVSEYFPNNGS